jgi:transposase
MCIRSIGRFPPYFGVEIGTIPRPTQFELAIARHAELVICDQSIERTFAWLCRQRRLSKDYEYHTECSEAWRYLASLRLLMCRLAKTA